MKVKKKKKSHTKCEKKRKEKEKEKEDEKKKMKEKRRIEELWSSKESTAMCLLSYEIPSFLTIIEMV